MPLFEYRCGKCGHVTEFLEKPNSKVRHACEQCGGEALEKVLSTFSARVTGPSSSAGNASCPTGTCPLT